MKLSKLIILSGILLLSGSCAPEPEPASAEHILAVTSEIDDARLIAADSKPGDWITYGKNYKEDRFSPLNKINKSNIDSLGLAWSINLGTRRGIEATPIVVDGIMYVTGPWSIVYAIDARKGKLIWTYDPEVPKDYGEKACCDVVNRGVAVYKGNVYVGTLDGRLVAINAASGDMLWETLTVDQSKAYTITGAPRVVDGKVLIGNGGAEYGVRGYITAYDALSGEEVWRFYTVPGNPADGYETAAMAAAAKTWTGEWWKFGGGGTAWDAIAYDAELNTVYIGVGNGSPWNRDIRSPEGGDNLYLSSIVALNPDDGTLKWHYQTTPGDTWDYTATQQIVLTDLEIDGVLRKVLMQAPKNGFFYVIDRTNGEFISAEPYVYVNWALGIDKKTARPVEAPNSRYPNMNTEIAPSAAGGHNWQPMAYSPITGLVYIPAREFGMFFGQPGEFNFIDDGRTWNTGSEFNASNKVQEDSLARQFYGKLIAWDPIAQKEIWNVTQPSPWNAGVLATRELVFQGTAEGEMHAFDAHSGEKLWSYPLNTGIIAPPITYEIDGVQYITIPVGWGGVLGLWMKFTEQINPGTLYTFALGKDEELPDFPKIEPKQLLKLNFEASTEEIRNGEKLYLRYCSSCHGGGDKPQGGGNIPDLKYSSPETMDMMIQIVGEGLFLEKGMPDFGDRLSQQDILEIKYYIAADAEKLRRQNNYGSKQFQLMAVSKRRRSINFNHSSYYFIGLFLLAMAGFWPTYFARFFDGTADFTFYVHFHAALALLWIILLIIQPFLINRKQFAIHRKLGKLSYLLVPLIYISVMLLAHSRITGEEENLGLRLWVPFKDLFIFTFGYGVALRYRKTMPIHARGMIVAGIVLIEPALARLIGNALFADGGFMPAGQLMFMGILYSLLLFLIIAERKEKKGRWVFPVTLGLYVFVHAVDIFQISVPGWQAFASWFAGLPLT